MEALSSTRSSFSFTFQFFGDDDDDDEKCVDENDNDDDVMLLSTRFSMLETLL